MTPDQPVITGPGYPAPTAGNRVYLGDAADAYARGRVDGAAAERQRIRCIIADEYGPSNAGLDLCKLLGIMP